MGCSSALPARLYWRAHREFAFSNGAKACPGLDLGGSCSTKKLAILRRIGMNGFSGILAATGLALGLALAGAPAMAQQPRQAAPAPAPATQPLKPVPPAALAAAR